MYLTVKSISVVPTTDNTATSTLTNSGVTIVTDASRGNVLYFNGSSWFNTNYLLPVVNTRCFWVKLSSTSSVNNTLSTITRPINFNQTNYINTSLNYNSTSGVSTSSLSFNGSNQYASLGSGTYYEYTTGTVEAWIKTTSNNANWQGIVNKLGSWYGLYLYGNVIVFWNSSTSSNVTTSVTVNDGNWHHVALSFQTGVTNGFNIYIDGVLNTSFTYNSYTTSANSFIIGSGMPYGSGQNFSGNIDEVRIWNIALTATQIAAYYNVRISPTTPGLTGYWYMDEGSGTTLNNAVSGGPAFTLYNSPTFSSNVSPVVNYRILDITNTVTTSSWNFYALTYDGTTAKLYRNGNLDMSVATTSTSTPDTLQIGAYAGSNNLNGYLDNIRCYSTALTQTQIQAIYNYELSNPNTYYLENVSMAMVPVTVTPLAFTTGTSSSSLVVSGQTGQNAFKNGTYIASGTNYWIGDTWTIQPWQVFTNNGNFWGLGSSGNGYLSYSQTPYTSTGIYQGGGSAQTFFTTFVQGGVGTLSGEWVQIQLPYSLNMTTYSLTQRLGMWGSYFLKNTYVVGSTDGNTWYLVDNRNLASVPADNSTLTYTTTTNNGYYNYFRFIIVNSGTGSGSTIPCLGTWFFSGNVIG